MRVKERKGKEQINHWRLSDYVQYVLSICKTLSEPPMVIGHSLGPAIAQRLLRDAGPMPAVVLMSPVPPRGLSHIYTRMLWSDSEAYQELTVALTACIHHV